MALLNMHFFSEVLALTSSLTIILPDTLYRGVGKAQDQAFPVLYLLHGGSDDHSNWTRNTSIERYAQDKGLMIVCPAVQYSFYADQKYGFDYFTYLSEELPRYLGRIFHISNQREDTFAAGISMGGYGAFKLGIVRPDKYAAVASLSGSLDQRKRLTPQSDLKNKVMQKMAYYSFGSLEEYEHSDNDLHYKLHEQLQAGQALPRFYMACGTKDFNFEINNKFCETFKSKVDVSYKVVPDAAHTWDFWDAEIRHVLDWLPSR